MWKVQTSLLAFLLAAFSFGMTQCKASESDSKVSASNLVFSIHPSSEKIYSGDPLPVEFFIRNIGSTDYQYYDDTDMYQLTCTSASGDQVDNPLGMSGLDAVACGYVASVNLKPGQEFHKTIFLNDSAKIIVPGRYSVTGFFRLQSGALITSKPETTEVLPRTARQMDEYVDSLESKLAGAKSREDRRLLWQKLMFTMQPSMIPMLINRMYEMHDVHEVKVGMYVMHEEKVDDQYWLSRALCYLPKEKVKPLVLRACMNRGLAPGMASVLYSTAQTPERWNVEPLKVKEWNEVITKSLAINNKPCWSAGCLEAQCHPSGAFTSRIIAIAMDPISVARLQAIYTLALNRTDDSVAALKQLLNDPDNSIRETARDAIKYAYCNKTSKDPGRRLRPADFDPALQTRL